MTIPIRQFRARRLPAHIGISTLAAAALAVIPAQTAHAAVVCEVTYTKTWDSGSSFGANITIRNLGDPLGGWTLTFTWPGNQQINQGWSANWSQTGRGVAARSMPWNGGLGSGASVSLGLGATYTLCGTSLTLTFTPANWNVPQTVRICAAEDADPVNGTRVFSFGGAAVGGATVTATEVDNDPVIKVDNPFAGAAGYVNADWRGQVNTEAANHPAPLATVVTHRGTLPWTSLRCIEVHQAGCTRPVRGQRVEPAVQHVPVSGRLSFGLARLG